MEDEYTSTKSYYDSNADHYTESTQDVNKFPTVKSDLDIFLPEAGDKCLDLGSGGGRDLSYMVKSGKCAVGVDVSRGLATHAKNSGAQIVLSDMRHLLFTDEAFDAVWSCASFLHIKTEEAKFTMKEINRVVKTGGFLYISVKEDVGDETDEKGRYFCYYSKEGLSKLLEESGFKLKTIRRSYDNRGVAWVSAFCYKV